jgi:fructose-1,6-bisphosphatase I
LDIIPTKLHQRTPLIIGSKNMVEMVEKFIVEFSNEEPSFA